MTSLPPQRQPRASSSSESHGPRARTNSFSAASVDSQTVLLNSAPAGSGKSVEAAPQEASAQAKSQPTEPDNEPRRCWICFNDETEDDETTSDWRSPCSCSLVAHEKCLLEWVADMEAPNARRPAGKTAGRILCPQCKSEIRLERPRSLAVEAVRIVEMAAKNMVIPSFLFLVGNATYSTFRWVGINSVYVVFGPQDARPLLRPLYEPPLSASNSMTYVLEHFKNHWRLDLGLPAIPIFLILSRTRMADSFLPFLPLVFLAGGGGEPDAIYQPTWPPSAAFTTAALPYLRMIYNMYYERFWLPHERRWLKEVQPRPDAVEEVDANAQAEGAADADAILDALAEDIVNEDEEDVVEVAVDVDLLFDWHDGGPADNNNAPENPPMPVARGPAPPLEAPPVDGEGAAAARADNDNPAPARNLPQQPAQPQRQRARRERNIGISTASFGDTVLGALFFPMIAAAVGEVLNLALPVSWVTVPSSGKPTGFLQSKWARSIVGGCLAVGMKDALLLYVRWRMAQNHRQRRVLDYDGSKGKRKKKVS